MPISQLPRDMQMLVAEEAHKRGCCTRDDIGNLIVEANYLVKCCDGDLEMVRQVYEKVHEKFLQQKGISLRYETLQLMNKKTGAETEEFDRGITMLLKEIGIDEEAFKQEKEPGRRK